MQKLSSGIKNSGMGKIETSFRAKEKKERIKFSMLLENSYHIAHKYISIKEGTANDPIRDTKCCPKKY